ncbi:RICIN domain-containing protein [Streptomyces sp. WM6372]|uniref:RICIN domain-containing protein n=1 Tax=Streptomyces sp. WM6372 TaxID=1415555 RepID=UPI00131D4F79|nr:ricin-type beta-trefoil lectin domain protein [Streptomyces sp. WM6372]
MIKNLMRALPALALTALPLLTAAPSSQAAGGSHSPLPAVSRAGDFEIRSGLHGKCLASNEDNVEVQNCRGTGSQLWFWQGRTLRNRAELHCLDVRNGEPDAPAQVVGDCHGQANQRWDVANSHLITQVNGQCLSIQNNGDPSEHAGINVRNCAEVAWQRWDVPAPA